MQRVNRILKNRRYKELVARIEELEADRIFCRHNMDHFLDVARIACLINEDEKTGIPRGIIYAASLLHDIGRVSQYEDGTEHETAGVGPARMILSECGFTDDETDLIATAISRHGDESVRDRKDLDGLLYRADKMSRKCFICGVRDRCHKPYEKLVMEIVY